jgi:hypothetical protein
VPEYRDFEKYIAREKSIPQRVSKGNPQNDEKHQLDEKEMNAK